MSGVELTEFVLARISEDEAAARRAAFGYGAGWTSETDDVEDWSVVHADGERDMVDCEDRDVTTHIARHDPARILAECAAKRALVVMCQPDPIDAQLRALATTNPAAWNLVGPLVEQADKDRSVALRLLALPYATHPDYREEWKP